ncbi:glutathione S-transferase family protein [Stakelama marina]|uniref:Glutathione S-transferase family protein n=1 Tax=Stakelama marina TaxID=2826939 RepID=A0A8T4IDI4_9SPHN|nr:glutathione S-transferase family protein [Stakelama marina]MBR0552563.1 glutathione S-transferase family protein [Stakelama marina]
MPVDPNAAAEIVAFEWVPDFARTYVRDVRVRWALEEAGIPYRTRLISALERPRAYFEEQPFGQVPAFRDGTVEIFESGAIVLYIGEDSERLLPRDAAARARAVTWVIASLNSVEPFLMELVVIDQFCKGEEWTQARRPAVVETIRTRLGRLSDALGGRDYLEREFTAGDLMMASVLRNLDHTELLAEFPNLAAYQKRCLGRSAYQAAVAAQCADFKKDAPISA